MCQKRLTLTCSKHTTKTQTQDFQRTNQNLKGPLTWITAQKHTETILYLWDKTYSDTISCYRTGRMKKATVPVLVLFKKYRNSNTLKVHALMFCLSKPIYNIFPILTDKRVNCFKGPIAGTVQTFSLSTSPMKKPLPTISWYSVFLCAIDICIWFKTHQRVTLFHWVNVPSLWKTLATQAPEYILAMYLSAIHG